MTADQKEAVRLWAESVRSVAFQIFLMVNDDKADAAIETLDAFASTATDIAKALRVEKTVQS